MLVEKPSKSKARGAVSEDFYRPFQGLLNIVAALVFLIKLTTKRLAFQIPSLQLSTGMRILLSEIRL